MVEADLGFPAEDRGNPSQEQKQSRAIADRRPAPDKMAAPVSL